MAYPERLRAGKPAGTIFLVPPPGHRLRGSDTQSARHHPDTPYPTKITFGEMRSSGARDAARSDKFDLWRELATAVEQSLRETLDGEPTRAIKAAA